MVECTICGKKAVYTSRTDGRSYCANHFIKRFERKARKTMKENKMFGKNERIVVATSGGKDSLALLHFLHSLSKKNPGWQVSALLIDEGISGYRDITKKDFLKFVEERDIEYKIISFEEEFGLKLDEIAGKGKYSPCTYCGVLRRYLMNKGAREMGATVLATAHNLDDTVQTALLNIFRNDISRLARLGPVTGISHFEGFVRKVKPFYEIPERETVVYAMLHGFFPSFVECPYVEYGMRSEVRRKLNELEAKYPGTKYGILSFLKKILPIIREEFEGKPNICPKCGELTSGAVCRTCEILEEIKSITP